MRSPSRVNDLGERVDQAFNETLERLAAGQFDSLEPELLVPVPVPEGAAERVGSKPVLSLEAGGRRYVFKLAEPALVAAEVAAYELRRLGDRPVLPARGVTVELPTLGASFGLLKPHLHFDAAKELGTDTASWSELQRAAILVDHAWDYFLDNLDTNTSQYALIGPRAVPVNIDWDRAFFSDSRSKLSRFAKYKATLPNARTFLYADYVEGKIELPFELLLNEARRIGRLPVNEVRRILERLADVRFGDRRAARHFVLRTLARQRRIEHQVLRFVNELTRERRALNATPETTAERVRKLSVLGWDHWQLVLNVVLRGPIGVGARKLLRIVRGLRHRRSAAPAGG